jgi:hypothetical protein
MINNCAYFQTEYPLCKDAVIDMFLGEHLAYTHNDII